MTDLFKKFIHSLKDGLYSTMDVDVEFPFLTPANLLNIEEFSKKYKPILLNSVYNSNSQIKHKEGVFSIIGYSFYIYLKKKDEDSDENLYYLTIIYESENYEEIKMFINILKKIK